MNRLGSATSPYLLQHADNPVDWWEWGDEAFTELGARRADSDLGRLRSMPLVSRDALRTLVTLSVFGQFINPRAIRKVDNFSSSPLSRVAS